MFYKEKEMTKVCSIGQHIDGEYVHNIYDVSKCAECGWRREPQTVTLGMFKMTSPNGCLKARLKKCGLRVIRNINILPSWCPLEEKK